MRIDSNLKLLEDVYSTAYASMVRYQYIEAIEKEIEAGNAPENAGGVNNRDEYVDYSN